MSFASILESIDKYIKVKPWLQFVGLMVAFGGLMFVEDYPDPAKLVAYIGLGVSAAGFVYEQIYP